MGKTPKKAAPGGDERNLNERRVKTTTATSKLSDTSLPERQRVSENSNRSKLLGISKKLPPTTVKTTKNKSRASTNSSVEVPLKRTSRLTNSGSKKSSSSTKKSEEAINMQPEADENDLKQNVETENLEQETTNVSNNDEKSTISEENILSQELINITEQSHTSIVEESYKIETSNPENVTVEEVCIAKNITKYHTISGAEAEFEVDSDIRLTLEGDEGILKVISEDTSLNEFVIDNKSEDSYKTEEKQANANDKEEQHTDVQTDTESYSIDIIESTTSDVSEFSEPLNSISNKDKQKPEGEENNESFITYDSSTMLKDPKVQLNDYVKENSKLYENTDDTTAGVSTQAVNDVSFGKSLRSISGRCSLNRMRHVTMRERRFSPNNSLFVNTSFSQNIDDGADCKILHYSNNLSESYQTNGAQSDKKRKLDLDESILSKKQKTESESSFLNTSLSYIKALRSPIQLSTSTLGFFKDKTKLNDSQVSEANVTTAVEAVEGEQKKWCIIM